MSDTHYRCPDCGNVDISTEINECPCGHGTRWQYVPEFDQKMVNQEAEWIRSILNHGVPPEEIECQVKIVDSPITYMVDFVFYGELAVEVKNGNHGTHEDTPARKGRLARQNGWDLHVVTNESTAIPCDRVWWTIETLDFVDWVTDNLGSVEVPSEEGLRP